MPTSHLDRCKIELCLALNIYEITHLQHKQVYFSLLVDLLKDELTRHDVSMALDLMWDCGMLKGGWENHTETGGWIYSIRLANIYSEYIETIYRKLKEGDQNNDPKVTP